MKEEKLVAIEKEFVAINSTSAPEDILDIIRNSERYVFVAPNTVDIRAFLDNVEEVQALVTAGRLVFHAWFPSWRNQWEKDLFSSALKMTVPAGKVLDYIPEAEALGSLIDKVAIPREEWLPNQLPFTEPAPDLSEIGLHETANRSQVLNACKLRDRPDVWNEYEDWYVKKLAYQHGCRYYLKGNQIVVA
jgi:hypothetical protein